MRSITNAEADIAPSMEDSSKNVICLKSFLGLGERGLLRNSIKVLVSIALLMGTIIPFNIYLAKSEHRTWIVDDDGGADFDQINDAVASELVSPGDTVFVKSGTYSENVLVDKPLLLFGENSGSTIVSGWNVSEDVITVVGEDVSITGFTIQSGKTGIFLNETTRCSISQNNIVDNTYGLGLHASTDIEIFENNIANNTEFGILLGSSEDNNVTGNNIANNTHGISLVWYSSNNILSRNNIVSNAIGILLSDSSNNIIRGNNIADNYFGVRLSDSFENRFYHNNFLYNNLTQVVITPPGIANSWDDGYPIGGNYWSDYNGTDLFRGIYQNVTGRDWVGDLQYEIDEENTDNYPLMGLFGPQTMIGKGMAVFPSRVVGLLFENVTAEGSTSSIEFTLGPEPPSGRKSVGQYYDIETTAGYSGKVTIRIVYDDANLTQEEEQSLQLGQWNSTGARMIGDITGPEGWQDGRVNILDIARVAKLFGVTYPDPQYDAICDLTGSTFGVADGKINIIDISFVAKNFGETTQQWTDITTYIDAENNLIYGETSHFSIFGVH